MGLLNLQELLKVVVSVIAQMGSSLSAACLNYLGVALLAEQCQNQLVALNLSLLECQIAAFRVTKNWGVPPVCRAGVLPQHRGREAARSPGHL